MKVEISSPTIASARIGTRSSSSRRTLMCSAASNTSAGRNMNSTPSEVISKPCSAARKSPTIPRLRGSTNSTTTPSKTPTAASSTV